MLNIARISSVRVAGDDERVIEYPAHDVIAVLRNLRLVGDEQPRSAEQPLLLEIEELSVVVDVSRDHSTANIVEDL